MSEKQDTRIPRNHILMDNRLHGMLGTYRTLWRVREFNTGTKPTLDIEEKEPSTTLTILLSA